MVPVTPRSSATATEATMILVLAAAMRATNPFPEAMDDVVTVVVEESVRGKRRLQCGRRGDERVRRVTAGSGVDEVRMPRDELGEGVLVAGGAKLSEHVGVG